MTEQLFQVEATERDLTAAEWCELALGPYPIFGGSAFPSDADRERAWHKHGARLIKVSNRRPWGLVRYGSPRP